MKVTTLVLICALMLMGLSTACAELICTPVDAELGFSMRGLSVTDDDSIIAYGYYGEPGDTRGALLRIRLNGSCENVTPSSDTYEGLYRGVIWLGDDHMVVMRSVPNDSQYRDFVAEFKDGQMIWHTEFTENMFFIEPVADNFFAYCKPARVTSEIWNMGMDGTIHGKQTMKERIILQGILDGTDRHIAYGELVEDPHPDGTDQRSNTMIFCFDDTGEILWRYQGTRTSYGAQLKHAAWAENGSVICIESYNIVKYDDLGEVWSTPITQGDAEYIFKIGDDYWVIGTTENYSSKQIIRINENGDILELKELPELTQDMIHPFLLDNEIYAIMDSGRETPLEIVRLTDVFD